MPPTNPGNAACDAGLGRTSLDFQSVEFRGRLLGVQEMGLGQRYVSGSHWYRNGILKS